MKNTSFFLKGNLATCYLIILLWLPIMLFSQKKQDNIFYLLNRNWSAARNMDDATYFMHLLKENDTTYVCRYYNKEGPMIRQETFMNAGLTIPHGVFCWYNAKGDLDSAGGVYLGMKSGQWNFYGDSNKIVLSILYRMGHIIEKKDYVSDVYTDSSGYTSDLKEKQRKEYEVFLADSIAGKLQRATFGKKEDNKEWQRYMRRTVNTPERWASIVQNGCCTVVSSFTVDTTGNIIDVYLEHSCEWAADAEVINAFLKGPKWNPATRDGKRVKYRQKEAVTFCSHEQ